MIYKEVIIDLVTLYFVTTCMSFVDNIIQNNIPAVVFRVLLLLTFNTCGAISTLVTEDDTGIWMICGCEGGGL
jgi:hypothetical protein